MLPFIVEGVSPQIVCNFFFLQNFTIRSLNLFSDFIFHELLELLDLDFKEKDDSCRRFHFMPRFVRDLPGELALRNDNNNNYFIYTLESEAKQAI